MKNIQQISIRRILKGVGLCIFLLISIPTIASYSLDSFDNLVNPKKEEKVLGVTEDVQQRRIDEIKKYILGKIPEKYQVIESEYEKPSPENDGCVFLYQIYPKEYTEMHKKYLSDANLIYCKDIKTPVLQGQTDEVKYSISQGKWLYEDKYPLETKQYGNNLVSVVELGGSHASSNYYILKLENSDELIILSIPLSNRVRCDTIENGIEVIKEDCIAFRDSITNVNESYEWVLSEVYDNYYADLLGILKEI